MSVVELIRSGKARDQILAKCARNIWHITSKVNINLVLNHIPGECNEVSDLLSRWEGSLNDFYKLANLLFQFHWIPVYMDMTILNDSI